MPPFDTLRFVCWLFAVVIGVIMVETMATLLACIWIIAIQEREPIGACQAVGAQVREVVAETLTGILALLAASRPK